LNDGRVVPNFILQALRGEELTVYGDGLQTRSFCYVDDLVEGIARLLFSQETEPVNLGNPAEFSILEFAGKVLEITGSRSRSGASRFPWTTPGAQAGHLQGRQRPGLVAAG